MFSCPRYIIHLNSCSKDSKLTIFRGFTVLHFRGISSISRDKRVILIYSRSATICHKVHHRTAVMVFLCTLKKPSLLVLEKFNVDHFSRSHGSSFARNFVYFSGQEGAPDIFAHCNDVSLGLTIGNVNGFLALNI